MSVDRFDLIQELFLAARLLQGKSRDELLELHCSGEPDLRREIESLLSHESNVPTFVDTAALHVDLGAIAAVATRSVVDELGQGTRIGMYTVTRRIGEGGFGEVYLAEQQEPLRRTVAIKILKPGMDSRAVIARFEQERQALTVMDHPNVARVFDAGTTDRGLPYFVMPYVDGEPINTFCDRHHLTVRERLELFIPVCEAVQHAHQKGIIHRDIKPSNILVGRSGSVPIPIVIDFGVAKAITRSLSEKTVFTETGQRFGTPEYMSPEQADPGDQDIDTRTDVYSLGVVLYELLVGALPFDPAELRGKGPAEIQRIIRQVDPPTPSTRLLSMGVTSARVATDRQTELNALANQLRRELEWIPLKALRKVRDKRYSTPHDLAEDIRRYLKGEPLEAAIEGAGYRLRKFLRLHVHAVVAVLAIAVSLLFGIVFVTVLMLNLRSMNSVLARQKAVAKESTSLLVEIFEKAQSELVGGEPPTMQDVLEVAARDFDERKWTDPETQATLLATLSAVLQSRGDLERAELHGRKAIELFEGISSTSVKFADALGSMANVEATRNRLLPSIELGKRALKILDPLIANSSVTPATAETWLSVRCNIATAMFMLAPADDAQAAAQAQQQAIDYLEESLTRARTLPIGSERIASVRSQVGQLYCFIESDTKAEPILRLAMEEFDQISPTHPSNATTCRMLAQIVGRQGKTTEACQLFTKAVEIQKKCLSPKSTDLAETYQMQGDFLRKNDLLDDAVAAHQAAVTIWEAYGKESRFPRTEARMRLSHSLLADEQLAEAERVVRQIDAEYANGPRDDYVYPGVRIRLAQVLLAQSKFLESEATLLDVLQSGKRSSDVRIVLVKLYLAWEKADPGAGHGAKAESYREPSAPTIAPK